MKQKIEDPMGYAGGYTLDLYCDHQNDEHPYSRQFPGYSETFFSQTYGGCARQARRAGWTIHRDRTATCPYCSGKK